MVVYLQSIINLQRGELEQHLAYGIQCSTSRHERNGFDMERHPQESSPLRRGKHGMAFTQNRDFFAEHSHHHHLYLNFTFNQLFYLLPGVSSSSSGKKKFLRGFFSMHCG